MIGWRKIAAFAILAVCATVLATLGVISSDAWLMVVGGGYAAHTGGNVAEHLTVSRRGRSK